MNKEFTYTVLQDNQPSTLERGDIMKDLGVSIDEKLTFREHIHCKINTAFMMLGVIKRNFKYLTISSFVSVYKSMVRSHLDYCSCVWSPFKKCDIEALEKVQKRATKILPKTSHLKYSDRLRACNLPTLHLSLIHISEPTRPY